MSLRPPWPALNGDRTTNLDNMDNAPHIPEARPAEPALLVALLAARLAYLPGCLQRLPQPREIHPSHPRPPRRVPAASHDSYDPPCLGYLGLDDWAGCPDPDKLWKRSTKTAEEPLAQEDAISRHIMTRSPSIQWRWNLRCPGAAARGH